MSVIFAPIFIIAPDGQQRPEPNDLVDARYVAARFGCSVRSVQRGACGTGNIPRVTSDPLRFRRADVDAELKRISDLARHPQKAKKDFPRLVRRKRMA